METSSQAMNGLQQLLDKDTYKRFLDRLDARALLTHYGAENMTEQANSKDGSTEIIHSCLLDRVEPHHTNGDQNPSAAVNLEKKTFVCYSLGFGCDLFHLVMKLEGKESLAESMTVVGEFLTGATLSGKKFGAEMEKVFSSTNSYSINLPSYDPSVLKGFDHLHPYWGQRGISQEAQDMLKLGYDPYAKRIVFPHYVQNTLVGWQKRVVPGETVPDYPKYKNSPGFPKSESLYNYDIALHYPRVLVVESPMSVARSVSMGVHNVVATFGAKVSQHQINLLQRNFDRIYIWFDRDGAGLQGERKLVEGLVNHTQVLVVTPDRGRDLGDADQVEMVRKLNEAVPAMVRLGQYRGKS